MAEKIKCKVCGYEYTAPPDFCPKCLTKPEPHSSVAELARAYGIKYWHRLSSLPELEDKPENRRLLAIMIDEEGAIGVAYVYRDSTTTSSPSSATEAKQRDSQNSLANS